MNRMRTQTRALRFAFALCSTLVSIFRVARADVSVNGLFADHAVLQRDATVPIWGSAEPDEAITVTFRDQKATATADASGLWKVELKNLKPGEPATLTIVGKNVITVADVLVGDVWLCSGQSNMAFELRSAENSGTEITAANYPLIRHIRLKLKSAETPQKTLQGQWAVCSPATAKDFTAVGYFFAKEVQPASGVPIGLINCTWGGTSATAWMSKEALNSDPVCAAVLDQWAKTLAEYPAAKLRYTDKLAEWEKAQAAAKATGMPFNLRKPNPPPGLGDRNTPAGLFNGMISPLIPYSLKGIVWYQGEQDASKYAGYRHWFPAMITQWRRDFGQGDLPFLYVQLPNHNSEGANSMSWAFMRGVQAEALALPNTGMAVTIDVGDNDNVHPKRKEAVGHRLALIAEAKVYGMKVPYEGPIFDSATVEANAMIVRFKRGAEGLKARGETLREFQLAGADKQFRPAAAIIEGSTLRVTSLDVANPIAVRYAWRNGSEANLLNKDDLPAAPFRSDNWK